MREIRTIEPLLLTVEETMATLRLGRNMVYTLIKREGLPVKHFGRRLLVDPDELKDWLKKRQ